MGTRITCPRCGADPHDGECREKKSKQDTSKDEKEKPVKKRKGK